MIREKKDRGSALPEVSSLNRSTFPKRGVLNRRGKSPHHRGWSVFSIYSWVVWGFIIIWVVKDAILFPFVRRAYDWDRPQGANSMVAARGIAKERLTPSGYVQIRGELWKAALMEGSSPLEKGERVRDEGAFGLRLAVVHSTIDEEGEND